MEDAVDAAARNFDRGIDPPYDGRTQAERAEQPSPVQDAVEDAVRTADDAFGSPPDDEEKGG